MVGYMNNPYSYLQVLLKERRQILLIIITLLTDPLEGLIQGQDLQGDKDLQHLHLLEGRHGHAQETEGIIVTGTD